MLLDSVWNVDVPTVTLSNLTNVSTYAVKGATIKQLSFGDYRRPALYGVDRLIEDKQEQLDSTRTIMYSDVIREREELSEQIRALKMLKELAKIYGCDISKPATNVLEAAQAVYFAYLAAVKEQNGAAMSLRT